MSTSRSFPNAFSRKTQERMDTREKPTEYPGAFQQKRRDDRQYGRTNPAFGQQSYGQWKRNEDPAKPKEVHIESTIDFPSLAGTTVTKTKEAVAPPTNMSLAEKLKNAIQQEQEQATQRSYMKDNEKHEDIYIPLSLSSFARRRQEEKKQDLEDEMEASDNEEIME